MIEAEGYDPRIYIASLLSIMWLRVFMVFRVTWFLGPLIKMFFAMFWDIIIFLLLYGLLLLTFASIGLLLFTDLHQFQTLYNAMIYCFGASLGNFDFELFETSISTKLEYAHLYLTLFLLINMVLVLNLLIAILSKTYAFLEPQAKALQLLEMSW